MQSFLFSTSFPAGISGPAPRQMQRASKHPLGALAGGFLSVLALSGCSDTQTVTKVVCAPPVPVYSQEAQKRLADELRRGRGTQPETVRQLLDWHRYRLMANACRQFQISNHGRDHGGNGSGG